MQTCWFRRAVTSLPVELVSNFLSKMYACFLSSVGCREYLSDHGVVLWWRSFLLHTQPQDFAWEGGPALPATDWWVLLFFFFLHHHISLVPMSLLTSYYVEYLCVFVCVCLCTTSLRPPVPSWAKHLPPGLETSEHSAQRLRPETSRWSRVSSSEHIDLRLSAGSHPPMPLTLVPRFRFCPVHVTMGWAECPERVPSLHGPRDGVPAAVRLQGGPLVSRGHSLWWVLHGHEMPHAAECAVNVLCCVARCPNNFLTPHFFRRRSEVNQLKSPVGLKELSRKQNGPLIIKRQPVLPPCVPVVQ